MTFSPMVQLVHYLQQNGFQVYIVTGGEIPALAAMDAVTRLLPGVMGGEGAADEESFQTGLLEYPQYTRPRVFEGHEVQ